MRLKQRSTVVLPQPEGPMNAVISLLVDVDVDVADGPEVAVVDVEVLDVEHDLAARRDGLVGSETSGVTFTLSSTVMVSDAGLVWGHRGSASSSSRSGCAAGSPRC